MATTLGELRTKCYEILREEENNSAYPYSLVDDLLNGAMQAVCSWLVINPLNQMEAHKWQLPFLNRETFYKTSLTQYVSNDVEAWATEIEMNTNTRPEEWQCYIWWKIVTYREKDENHLYQCTWIDGQIKAWTQASIIYKVPADFMSPVNVILDDRVQIDNKDYDDVFESLRDNKWVADYRFLQRRGYDKPFYTIKDDTYLILWNINTANKDIRLRYERIPAPMENSEDVCVIPNDIYAKNVIPYLAVWEVMYNRWEEERGAQVINYWMWKLKEMYKYFNKTWVERNTSQQYRMGKARFNI